MLKQGADEEIKRETPKIEERREWHHGSGGRGEQCDRAAKPVVVKPGVVPGVCRSGPCDNQDWRAGSKIWRTVGDHKEVRRVKADV